MPTVKKPTSARKAPAKASARASAKPAYHHGDLRRALLDAGLALIEEQGAHAFTLREAARRAGVSQAAPYRHFVDKDALLGALAEEGFRALTARMQSERDAPHGIMGRIGLGYVLFAVENPAHYRVMFGPLGEVADMSPATLLAGQECFQVLLDTVAAAQASGLLRAGDTQELALFAWSLVHGLALLVIDGRVPLPRADAKSLRAFVTRMLTLQIEGMAAR